MEIKTIDTGLKGYTEVLALQEEMFNKNLHAKTSGGPTTNYLILCEHKPVYTLGKSGKRENIIVPDEALNAEYYHVNRGGDVTFHGPGQLVAYPVLDLDTLNMGLAQYIYNLEKIAIESLKDYELNSERIEDAAGVWLRGEKGDRKICAIGVKASRHITMHGLAMNINTDLTYFDKIIPCGLIGKSVTSLQKELNRKIDFEDYKQNFIRHFNKVFGFEAN
ncbi:MAG TPA: lipoyl(octanoyl) transferase LipB [Chitinophagales bacterium]|nr:lipoyl(octanoyl) transferase LipB [Chitinophagales bacterium]